MHTIWLKPDREKSLLRRHPWVFASAIQSINGSPGRGETVRINSAAGEFLAWGAFSPDSQIRARVWSWKPDESIDRDFFRQRLQKALTIRGELIPETSTDALRLVHAESDGLPGLVVDRYGEILVVQLLSSGAEYWRDVLADELQTVTQIDQIFERSDADVRQLEGLPQRVGPLRGSAPPAKLTIRENGIKHWVDLQGGHKTGFYLDQRANRLRLRTYAANRDVLDCFSYTGGFLLNALWSGAKTAVAVDASNDALALSRENLVLNGLSGAGVETLPGDVFQVLRSFRDQRREFDLIVLDPPKFAPTISQAERAARGYKDINLLALKLLRPGGYLFTFSCSGGISPELFQKILAGAAEDAGIGAQIIEHLHQDADHPIALNFPEGEYLKGLVIRKN
jgi:23S rRNA (cytosine1962-C5)-methyltransferase